jgi:NADH-quinone oxidoreductase subunit L
VLGWVVDKAILGGAAWLLGGIATFSGALLQRWQSGNLRSYAAWLAAGAAALLLFLFAPAIFGTYGISFAWKGW